jgi:hypothetical protein
MFGLLFSVILLIAFLPDVALWLPRLLVPKLVPATPM